ncbi:MAG TPA: PP0621 family protein [Casimicrobiaceae bacterium]
MSKIIAWLILIFVVLFALRMISLRNARRQRRAAAARSVAEAMVRCRRCGVFLPRSEARSVDDGFVCADGGCAKS